MERLSMKALSLWQPYASLMAINAKGIETRDWSTNYRGLVAIHAALKWNKELEELTVKREFWTALQNQYTTIASLPLGCFVAVGKLHRCLSTDDYKAAIPKRGTNEFVFGDYSSGRHMWVFSDVWKLAAPIFATGQRKLWTPSDGELDAIGALLPDNVEDQLLKEQYGSQAND
jgi:hypothetical protein